jgi:hypothetical protein
LVSERLPIEPSGLAGEAARDSNPATTMRIFPAILLRRLRMPHIQAVMKGQK